jgi:hypothetical protein
MNLAVRAFAELYGKEPDHEVMLKYHGNLNGFNATVRKTPRLLVFTLSRKLQDCEPEIQIGVMQYLLNKLNKTKIKTDHIDLYHAFLRRMSDFAPVTISDPVLEASFQRCNEKYFAGMMTQPNLTWGGYSLSLLGTYTYATDTILISQVMKEDDNMLDYIMHHEMLHKKHKFKHTSMRTHSHTTAFKRDEEKFEEKDAERKLKLYLSQRRAPAIRRIPRSVERPTFVQRIMGWMEN